MSKIIVPQELQNKIIDLYVNKKYGRTRIVKELRLPFGEEKVKNILKDNNIHIRNYQEARAIGNYAYSDLRKFQINDSYNFNSHNGAWMLGFYAADGYLPVTKGAKNRVVLSLQLQDKNILEMIKIELNYNGEIYQYYNKTKHKDFCTLAFTSSAIRQQLENYGIVNNKTFIFNKIPNISDTYKLDFIRGYFDGDGSIYFAKPNRVKMNFTSGNKYILLDIVDYLYHYYDFSKQKIHVSNRSKHPSYSFCYGKQESFKLGHLFYDNDYLALPRKKQHFYELEQQYPIIRHNSPKRLDTPQG